MGSQPRLCENLRSRIGRNIDPSGRAVSFPTGFWPNGARILASAGTRVGKGTLAEQTVAGNVRGCGSQPGRAQGRRVALADEGTPVERVGVFRPHRELRLAQGLGATPADQQVAVEVLLPDDGRLRDGVGGRVASEQKTGISRPVCWTAAGPSLGPCSSGAERARPGPSC